jgi:hypothetical protein
MGELHLAVYTYIVRALPPRSLQVFGPKETRPHAGDWSQWHVEALELNPSQSWYKNK